MASLMPPESSWATGGPSRPLGNLIWVVPGCALGAPGDSWAALGASRGAPGSILASRGSLFGALWDLSWRPRAKLRKARNSSTVWHFLRFFQVPRAPKSRPEGSMRGKMRPRGAQEHPRGAQERPRRAQEAPKRCPTGAQGIPRGAQEPSRGT